MTNRYSLRRPSSARLERLRTEAETDRLTYPRHGASVTGDPPDGFHWHESELTTEADWEAAKNAIRRWSGHRSAGAILSPGMPPLEVGSIMSFAVRVAMVWATGTCRIVRVFDDPGRFGFSYGTLMHHPESGEEMFAVRDNGDGTVTFRVAAFSRPAGYLTTMLGPFGRLIQRAMTRRYLAGFAASAGAVSATERR